MLIIWATRWGLKRVNKGLTVMNPSGRYAMVMYVRVRMLFPCWIVVWLSASAVWVSTTFVMVDICVSLSFVQVLRYWIVALTPSLRPVTCLIFSCVFSATSTSIPCRFLNSSMMLLYSWMRSTFCCNVSCFHH